MRALSLLGRREETTHKPAAEIAGSCAFVAWRQVVACCGGVRGFEMGPAHQRSLG